MSAKGFTATSSSNSPYQALLLLSLILVWGVGIFILLLVFKASPDEQYKALYYSIDATRSLFAGLRLVFRYSDDWNWLTLFVIFTLLIIVFCLNDLFLRPLFHRWFQIDLRSNDLWFNGLVWLARIATNMTLSLTQVILVAFLINVSVGSQRILPIDKLSGSYDVVLLGTAKYLSDGKSLNLYYQQRIDAVQRLYEAGMVHSILISGDHQGAHYSEPTDMRNDLVVRGIPQSIITLDLQGYRTFDSIKKLRPPLGQPLLFVSQQFHLERALFISANSGITAIGYAAQGDMTGAMVKREALAKTKVILDIYILNTQAFGLPAYPRRRLSIFNASDLILLIFVMGIVAGAGRLSRNLLIF